MSLSKKRKKRKKKHWLTYSEDINKQRETILTHLFDKLRSLQSQLLDQSLGCSQGCRAMMYGTLNQGMNSNSLLPLPPPPYTSLKIAYTFQQLRAVEGLDYYCPWKADATEKCSGVWDLKSGPRSRKENTQTSYLFSAPKTEVNPAKLVRHDCRIEDHLRALVNVASGRFDGLNLSQYINM